MDDVLLDGRYRSLRRLGAGGMGEVWLAHDERLDRYVAIKRVLLDGHDGDEQLIRMMRREAQLAANMKHRHIVTVHDLLEVRGHPYLVMEYVEGETMDARLRRRPPVTPFQSAGLVAQMASALSAAHDKRIVHRDVKPHNVLIDQEGVAKLADFGIARAIETMLTRGGGPAGTFAYMAPEVARTGEATPASDVWSLGATFFDATDGHPPHMPPGVQHLGELFQRILTRDAPRPQRAGEFTDLVSRMLATDPAARPAMAEVLAEIRHLRGTGGRRHTDPPPRRPPPRPPPDPPPDDRGPRVPPEHQVVTGEFVYSPRQRAVLTAIMVASVAVVVAVVVLVLTAGDGAGGGAGDGGTSPADRGPSDGVSAVGFEQANEIIQLSDGGFDTDGLTVEVGDVVQFRAPQFAYYRLSVGDLPAAAATQEEGLSYEFSEVGTYVVTLADVQDEREIEEIEIVVR